GWRPRARRSAHCGRTSLPGAGRAYDAARIASKPGKFNFLDVLDAQRTLFQARAQYLAALSRAHQAAAGIDRILGR
ncbi:TolC family protein, partial [Ralstonia pseudosolanacearum]